jgi:ABC-type Na+ efflux pump permease subunit
MIDSQPGVPSEPETSDRPLTVLRGAGVDVDPRRAVQLVVAVSLVALTVVAVILLLAGTKKNSQAVSLHDHGVPVTVTVSGCLGLLGGSGSNPAGYSCKGSYTFDGHRYQQALPGNALLRPGAVVQGVIDPGDPSLLSTPGAVADQHASWRVFILPVILFALVAMALVVLLARNRRRAPGAAGQPPDGRAVGA